MATHDCPLVRCHAMHQSRSRMASTVQLIYIVCSKACSWRDVNFVYRNAVYRTNKVSPFLYSAVAFRETSSTAALMKLLLPIEIHVAVCDLQATHRPTITGLLLQNCVSIAATWCVEQRSCTGRRPPRCSNWILKTVFKITYNNSKYQSQLLY